LWGYTILSKSGECRPDPDDTVMHFAQSDGVTLTDYEAAFLTAKVIDEFKKIRFARLRSLIAITR
jgi:hypothetical protein